VTRILLVDDDENKRRAVREALSETAQSVQIEEARSLQSGLQAIANGIFDLAILDMTMPTFDITAAEDGGRPQAYGGRELLRHMSRRGLSMPVVILTQFDRFGQGVETSTLQELDGELHVAHPDTYRGAIYYDLTGTEWKEQLSRVVRTLSRREKPGEQPQPDA
jgi:CheY-like chemotaxis protein